MLIFDADPESKRPVEDRRQGPRIAQPPDRVPVLRLEDWRRQALAGVEQARHIRALDEQEAMPVGEGAS